MAQKILKPTLFPSFPRRLSHSDPVITSCVAGCEQRAVVCYTKASYMLSEVSVESMNAARIAGLKVYNNLIAAEKHPP